MSSFVSLPVWDSVNIRVLSSRRVLSCGSPCAFECPVYGFVCDMIVPHDYPRALRAAYLLLSKGPWALGIMPAPQPSTLSGHDAEGEP